MLLSGGSSQMPRHPTNLVIRVPRYKPELNALMDLVLFRFTIFRNEPTPGMRMQNLRYSNALATPGSAAFAGE
jgi:hypothetical protein